jgi:hypothetical protein
MVAGGKFYLSVLHHGDGTLLILSQFLKQDAADHCPFHRAGHPFPFYGWTGMQDQVVPDSRDDFLCCGYSCQDGSSRHHPLYCNLICFIEIHVHLSLLHFCQNFH